jgi:hypothetical protein
MSLDWAASIECVDLSPEDPETDADEEPRASRRTHRRLPSLVAKAAWSRNDNAW